MAFQRFRNRELRIQRREERNFFRRRLLPIAWVVAAFGATGLLIVGAYRLLYEVWPYQFAGLAATLTVLPLVLGIVGWLRGHTSDQLDEP